MDREGLIAYVDDSDNVAPYRINGMNIRESDIVEKIAKRRGRPAAKKQIEEKTEVVVNAVSEPKPEETQVVESIQEEEPLQQPSSNQVHEEEPEVEPTLVEKYQAFKSTINMAEFNDLVDLVTADTKKMRQMMAESMLAIASDCGLKA